MGRFSDLKIKILSLTRTYDPLLLGKGEVEDYLHCSRYEQYITHN